MAKLMIPTPLRKYTGNQANVMIEGKTAGECLAGLGDKYPELKKNIFDDNGNLKNFVVVYLEDEDIRHLQGTETPVNESSVLSIVPAIAGG